MKPDQREREPSVAMSYGVTSVSAAPNGYLNVFLMNLVGVASTVMMLGAVYFVVMLAGSRLMASPPAGWKVTRAMD